MHDATSLKTIIKINNGKDKLLFSLLRRKLRVDESTYFREARNRLATDHFAVSRAINHDRDVFIGYYELWSVEKNSFTNSNVSSA